jgi:hypothetical protein
MRGVNLPLTDDGVVLHTVGMVTLMSEDYSGIKTYLLILSILSIFLIPSQCRISGIKAWNLISFTPAIFSVRLKYSEARSAPRFRAL